MKIKLRWKREPKEKGLTAIGAGPRGSKLWDGEYTYASTNPIGGNWRKPFSGWYWWARCDEMGIPLINTCDDPCETEQEAKAHAKAYVLEHLKKREKQ